jgi:hypothetical protein
MRTYRERKRCESHDVTFCKLDTGGSSEIACGHNGGFAVKPLSSWTGALALGMILISPRFGSGQTKMDAAPADSSTSTPDYPESRAGVLIKGSDWAAMDSMMPSKTRTKGGITQSLSYGAVRGSVVADYNGEHAAVQIKPGRVVICICRMISLPADPLIVRLHPQKGMRELDGGKLAVLGAKMAEATKSDLIPADVSHPDSNTWLVRSQDALPEGEYALMIGAQNMAIFPFTISAASNDSSNSAK